MEVQGKEGEEGRNRRKLQWNGERKSRSSSGEKEKGKRGGLKMISFIIDVPSSDDPLLISKFLGTLSIS